jgi:hypothetical protein
MSTKRNSVVEFKLWRSNCEHRHAATMITVHIYHYKGGKQNLHSLHLSIPNPLQMAANTTDATHLPPPPSLPPGRIPGPCHIVFNSFSHLEEQKV